MVSRLNEVLNLGILEGVYAYTNPMVQIGEAQNVESRCEKNVYLL